MIPTHKCSINIEAAQEKHTIVPVSLIVSVTLSCKYSYVLSLHCSQIPMETCFCLVNQPVLRSDCYSLEVNLKIICRGLIVGEIFVTFCVSIHRIC